MNVLATSGGFVAHPTNPYRVVPGPMITYALDLADTGRRPRVCYLGTATGDDPARLAAVYAAFAEWTHRGRDVHLTHLALFPMPSVPDPAAHLLAQDLVWVGGGSVANLLAVWRVHGVDAAMAEAWRAGVVLAGSSAGSICWHVGGTTDSFGTDLRPATDGLGLLPHGNGVHHDSEPGRRPLLRALVAAGTLPSSYATDDGVGLHYRGTELAAVVAERADAFAWHVASDGAGGAVETRLEPILLGDGPTPAP